MTVQVFSPRIAVAVIALLLCCSICSADDFKDFAELDLEALLNTDVYSASKREQKISEAPNAIYVITAEDIKRSGAVNIPDLLRMIPLRWLQDSKVHTSGWCPAGVLWVV